MTDERPTHGGAANMPPFPRASSPGPARPDPDEAPSTGPDSTANGEEAPRAPAAEKSQTPEPGAASRRDDSIAPDDGDSELGDDPDGSDDRPLDAAPGDLDTESADDWDDESDEEDFPDPDDTSFRSAVTSELARRAEMSVLKGMEHVADTFEQTARRINRMARLRGGPEAASIGPVHSTVGWLEGAADYLRSSDLEVVQSDLRQRVRTRPVQSLGLALCAGWLIGRILR